MRLASPTYPKAVSSVHPLARMFLLAKLKERTDALDVARDAFDLALEQGFYDEAFGLVEEFALEGFLERLIVNSVRSPYRNRANRDA